MKSEEYKWAKQTRNILLNQCSELSDDELSKELGFGFQSIKNTLIHIAGCYHAWLGAFVLENTENPLFTNEIISDLNIEDIKTYFEEADTYVYQVLKMPEKELQKPLYKKLIWNSNDKVFNKTPQQLLFHSVTHEYHHKGQIVTMLRMLGYTPQNTDVLMLDM
ncbi:DinB family protein [Mammaliicoccus sciuri]|uniref:DinB family protein n=1 Tax=Mammaliicoccus sciuri TaxID=1296 RepID=UPI0030D62AD6